MFSTSYLQADEISIAWIWYMLLAVLLLVLIFWWINRRSDQPRTESSEVIQTKLQEQTADDLKRIEGIGPKVEAVLNDAGIATFDALARADPARVKDALNAAGLQMMNPEGWIEQAGLAAKGDWEKLERLQDKLKGGRKQ